MNTKQVRIYSKRICQWFVILLLLMVTAIVFYQLAKRNYPEAFCALLVMIPLFYGFYTIEDLFMESIATLTPACLSLTENAFMLQFQNRFRNESVSRGHVMAYVIVETETRHIYFLNCAYISRGINSSLDPFSKEIKRTYVNKADCEISRLRGARKIAFDYYAIYWDDHFALLFTKSPEFPLLEYILRNNGFDIETRIYCANELTSADVLVGCLFQLALIGGMIIGTLAAPIHASTITTLLYIILVTGSFLMAIWQGRRIMSYSISETTKEISRKDD